MTPAQPRDTCGSGKSLVVHPSAAEMTSRVQKGSTVFRPVAKVRGRAPPGPSRQTSVVDSSLLQSSDISLAEPITSSLPPNSGPSFSLENHATSVDSEPQTIPNSSLANTNVLATDGFRKPVQVGAPILQPRLREATSITPRPSPSVPAVISTPSIRPPPRMSGTPVVIDTPRERIASPVIIASSSRAESQVPLIVVAEPSSIINNDSHAPPGSTNSQEVSVSTSANPQESLPSSEAGPSSTEDKQADTAPKPARKRKSSSAASSKKPKRKRSVTADPEDTDDGEDRPKSRKGSRAPSSTPRPRKRAPSPPPYDPDADPGEDIDPTTVTMAELCDDTGQGRVSSRAAEILSNHAAWKVKNREKRARMRLVMEAKKYGREEDADAPPEEAPANPLAEAGPSASTSTNTPVVADETGNGFDYTQDLTTSRYNVQVRIGPNGETIIDEESLVVDRVDNDGTENYTHVVESDQTKFVNSGSYGKRYRGSRWSAEETELFYDALAQYGENYELIAYVLPGRDRKSCKNKFKVEDKRNHARINHCLNNSIPVDMKTLSKMTGKDFSGPVPEIRIPTPLPTVPPPPAPEIANKQNAENSQRVKKRSRSRSQGIEAGVVVLGNAENFDNGFDAD